jgi:hypothetical protein
MSTYELNEGSAATMMKPGDPGRNLVSRGRPNGSYLRNREIKAILKAEGDQPCGQPGFESLTKFEFTIVRLWQLAMDGDRWATTTILNRLFGRVPTSVELNLQARLQIDEGVAEIEHLSNEELVARLDRLRQMAAIDADFAPLGYGLTGNEPTSPDDLKEAAWVQAFAADRTTDFLQWEQSYTGPPSDWPRKESNG